jgi:hypothetical protein
MIIITPAIHHEIDVEWVESEQGYVSWCACNEWESKVYQPAGPDSVSHNAASDAACSAADVHMDLVASKAGAVKL